MLCVGLTLVLWGCLGEQAGSFGISACQTAFTKQSPGTTAAWPLASCLHQRCVSTPGLSSLDGDRGQVLSALWVCGGETVICSLGSKGGHAEMKSLGSPGCPAYCVDSLELAVPGSHPAGDLLVMLLCQGPPSVAWRWMCKAHTCCSSCASTR